MKKIILLVLAFSLVASLLIGCTSDTEVSDKALALGLDDGVLNIGVDDTYPPMEYRNEDNELVGFDIDLAKALGEELGVPVEFTSSSWEGIFTGLTAKQYDVIISSVSMTTDRMATMDYSNPYLANGQVIVVKTGNTSINSKADLAGKKVGVQIATTSDTATTKQLETMEFELTQYNDIISCFTALKIGAIDCIVVDMAVAIEYCSNAPEDYTTTTTQLTNEPIAVALQKGDITLQEAINAALVTLSDNGTLTKISNEHLGSDYTQNIDTKLTE